jgi:rhodanese-related sulfurtransferase
VGLELQSTGTSAVDDVSAHQVWEQLKTDPASVLVDVRTRAEWAFVGLPDLSSLGKRVVTVEWQTFPDNSVDPAFTQRLQSALSGTGAGSATELYFICRSGGRSRMAAEAMAALGYQRCHNVADGFEGPLDQSRHRGTVGGWKAAGLAWAQG